ncbi:uncharacterized protein H6S33_009393 [Morchella sextelata]|uniref:uncharacterized protein n=1 Tax=Morchella sextelata TaxID=1174677 RepID=UPI001D03B55A|nr:uncharacterized protein H6S33_009393 [Morchella sextelata]KAH0613013.1 hypothetical protein H6S33_009393 [Morchella sextelata]
MARFYLILSLAAAAGLASATDIWGYGEHTTGGAGAPKSSIYTVTDFNELRTALDNNGAPHDPKIIYINGLIDGDYLADGSLATEEHYARNGNYTFERYLDSFNATLRAILGNSTDPADAAELTLLDAQETFRQAASNEQEAQIVLKIGNNTTIESAKKAKVARIQNSYIALNQTDNVILRNFEVYSPIDLFPEWDPTDGSTGNWNSKYDCVGVVTSTNIWIDHLTLSDGDHPDSDEPIVFGHQIQRHDGLIDITEGSDAVTLSFNKLLSHDKTNLIGNNDAGNLGPGDTGRLHVTMYGNHYYNSLQRSPRVRFGEVHVFNNYFEGQSSGDEKIVYFFGMGINSTILSERNAFSINGTESLTTKTNLVVGNYKGYRFKDVKSTVNGTEVDLEAVAKTKYDAAKASEVAAAAAAGRAVAEWATHEYTDVVFTPPYEYRQKKAEDVAKWVLKNAGYGNL